eukprot:4388282-Prymnesium_polylepis.1
MVPNTAVRATQHEDDPPGRVPLMHAMFSSGRSSSPSLSGRSGRDSHTRPSSGLRLDGHCWAGKSR